MLTATLLMLASMSVQPQAPFQGGGILLYRPMAAPITLMMPVPDVNETTCEWEGTPPTPPTAEPCPQGYSRTTFDETACAVLYQNEVIAAEEQYCLDKMAARVWLAYTCLALCEEAYDQCIDTCGSCILHPVCCDNCWVARGQCRQPCFNTYDSMIATAQSNRQIALALAQNNYEACMFAACQPD